MVEEDEQDSDVVMGLAGEACVLKQKQPSMFGESKSADHSLMI